MNTMTVQTSNSERLHVEGVSISVRSTKAHQEILSALPLPSAQHRRHTLVNAYIMHIYIFIYLFIYVCMYLFIHAYIHIIIMPPSCRSHMALQETHRARVRGGEVAAHSCRQGQSASHGARDPIILQAARS